MSDIEQIVEPGSFILYRICDANWCDDEAPCPSFATLAEARIWLSITALEPGHYRLMQNITTHYPNSLRKNATSYSQDLIDDFEVQPSGVMTPWDHDRWFRRAFKQTFGRELRDV